MSRSEFLSFHLDTKENKFESQEQEPEAILSSLKNLVSDLNEKSSKLREFCDLVQIYRGKQFCIPKFLEKAIVDNFLISSSITPSLLSSVKVAAVDGGTILGSLAGVDLIGLRSCGAIFTYTNGCVTSANYFPSKNQNISILPVRTNFSTIEINQYQSIKRAILELRTAVSLLNDTSYLDYLLMDGSFQLKRRSFPNNDLNNLQGQYFAWLRKLVNKSQESGVKLVFVVKDTRLTIFTEIIGQLLPHIIEEMQKLYQVDYRLILKNLRDSVLFSKLLPVKTRSFLINRTYLEDQIELNFNPNSFFLKVVEQDLPLRIDFFTNQDISIEEVQVLTDEISQIVIALSDFNPFYSLPAPIIEADARSRISIQEFNFYIETLQSLTFGSSFLTKPLKRNNSPFKF